MTGFRIATFNVENLLRPRPSIRLADMKTRHFLTRIAACVIAVTAIGVIAAGPTGTVAFNYEDRTLSMPNWDVDIGTGLPG